MQLNDVLEILKAHVSYDRFVSNHSARAEAIESAGDEFKKELEKANIPAQLTGDVEVARKELSEIAEIGRDGWQVKGDVKVTRTTFDKALGKYKQASLKLNNFLSGAQSHDGVRASQELSGAFREYKAALEKARSTMGNPFGMARVNGWKDVGETIDHNLKGMKFWEDGVVPMKRVPAVAFRGGALVAAGVGIGDSLLRKRTADGEDRGAFERVVELAASVGVGGAALLAGRAL